MQLTIIFNSYKDPKKVLWKKEWAKSIGWMIQTQKNQGRLQQQSFLFAHDKRVLSSLRLCCSLFFPINIDNPIVFNMAFRLFSSMHLLALDIAKLPKENVEIYWFYWKLNILSSCGWIKSNTYFYYYYFSLVTRDH